MQLVRTTLQEVALGKGVILGALKYGPLPYRSWSPANAGMRLRLWMDDLAVELEMGASEPFRRPHSAVCRDAGSNSHAVCFLFAMT